MPKNSENGASTGYGEWNQFTDDKTELNKQELKMGAITSLPKQTYSARLETR